MLTLFKSGDRVGVVHSTVEGTANLLGYGVYLGQQTPEAGIDLNAVFIRNGNGKAPAVKLDSGPIVYDWEWDWIEREPVIDERFRNYKIEILDIQKIRNDGSRTQ